MNRLGSTSWVLLCALLFSLGLCPRAGEVFAYWGDCRQGPPDRIRDGHPAAVMFGCAGNFAGASSCTPKELIKYDQTSSCNFGRTN